MSGGMVGAHAKQSDTFSYEKNTSFNSLKNVLAENEEGELEKLEKKVSLFITKYT